MGPAYKMYEPPHLGEGSCLLVACDALHSHAIGTGDGLQLYQLFDIADWLKTRVDRFGSCRPMNTYEAAVLTLVHAALASWDAYINNLAARDAIARAKRAGA
jgi:hypothetical protein